MTLRTMPAGAASVPHLDQFYGEWAMEPRLFKALADTLFDLDVAAHLTEFAAECQAVSVGTTEYQYAIVDSGVAILPVSGTMTKHETSMSRFGFGGVSTALLRKDIRKSVLDTNVKSLLIHIESGGGTARGTKELCDEIARAASIKPTTAFIEDIGASAAYWAACGASKIVANAPAKVGSIGTYGIVHDTHKRNEARGIITTVVRAGKFKGAAAPGTEITPEMLTEFQREIDATNEFFIRGVAAGRKLQVDTVRELADGRVHTAEQAKDLRLIDSVDTFDNALSELVQRSPIRRSATPAGKTKPYHEMTEGEKQEYVQKIEQRSQAKTTTTFRKRKPIVTQPTKPEPSASEQWKSLIRAEMDRTGKSSQDAARIVNRQNPGLRERYLAEANS